MTWLLDTDVCIGLLRGRLPQTAARMQGLPRAEVSPSPPGGERAGVRWWSTMLAQTFNSLPFDDECARLCAIIRATLEKAGTPIGPYDYQIAAIGQWHGLTAVTRNVTESKRVRSLIVEDWET